MVDQLEGHAVVGQHWLAPRHMPECSQHGGRYRVRETQVWKLVEYCRGLGPGNDARPEYVGGSSGACEGLIQHALDLSLCWEYA